MRTLPYTPPSWLTFVNASLFIAMSSVSILQNTIFLRNLTLIAGALIGVYIIYQNRNIFSLSNSFPLLLLALLFIWALVHFLFFAVDPHAQLNELSSVWKRVFLSFLFAIGLGLSIRGANKVNQLLVICGFGASVTVFYVRWLINLFGFGTLSPFFIQNYFDPNALGYVPKYYFSTFVVPFVAMTYFLLFKKLTDRSRYRTVAVVISGIALLASLYIFYAVINKNGILYFLIISVGFLLYFLIHHHHKLALRTYLVLGLLISCLSPLVYLHINAHSTWKTFIVDSKAALDFENNTQWMHTKEWIHNGQKDYPLNKYGTLVSTTTYERVAWAAKGSELILSYPLGYGLLINSFGSLAKLRWPEANLNHSHSGWVDLGLAFGIPGLVFILISLFGAVIRCSQRSAFIPRAGTWVLLSMVLVFVSSEVAERILFDYLIFLIAFFAASTINAD